MTPHPALARLGGFPVAPLGHYPTPIDEVGRFRAAAGLTQRVFVKRDDAIAFGFGGNKVRKLRYQIPSIIASGADTVITCGGVQSNHARATAAAAAASGLACHIVVNGAEPVDPSGNALLNRLLGATFEYVAGRADRRPAMDRAAERLRSAGRRPALIPLGASTPHGALGYLSAIGEMVEQGMVPDVIVHACSSGGTSAGILAGCRLHGLPTRVIGISADDPPAAVEGEIRALLGGLEELLELEPDGLNGAIRVEVDDGFVGPGYGETSPQSIEAQSLAARTEALFVDHTYTAKALAGLIGYCRDRRISADANVLFWHTGGQVALFA
jgi:1-aminocyclopropane-1-carboxylate deaminase/D-cysteine desulfhydrase-like pyridoxal-dependent ACC family enzyme